MKIHIFLLTALSLSLASAAEWETLFDGKNLDHWTTQKGEPVTKGWVIQNGELHRPKSAGSINSKKSYQNFILEFDWKISEAGNSGVKYRFADGLGLEYQILDDSKHKDRKNPTHRTASLYDIKAAPDTKPVNPVGQWNHAKIVANGTKIEHWLNGKLVVSIDQSTDEWKTAFAKSKYKKAKNFGTRPGHIHLQDHQDPVWFRNIRIQSLD
ncbi:MAG: 3-keto-disaccharide hydrolase [Verrucomicrobiales bacterium]|nr:DUF1080 domain-containing protein [Verrucomicrobiota bacterium JB025]